MHFFFPWALLLIPIILLLLRPRRNRSSIKVASTRLWPQKPAGKSRYLWLPKCLRSLAILLTVAGIAGPMVRTAYESEVKEGIAIQMLVDVSSSMDMTALSREGTSVRRLDFAKEIVEQFIAGDGETLAGRPHDLIGLITFARYADTRSPLTFGHEALLEIVRHLEIQERPNEDGTAYGDALAIAAARLKNLEELKSRKDRVDLEAIQSRIIILLTDGENNSGSHLPVEAAGLAKAWGCRIYSISLGEQKAQGLSAGDSEALNSAERVLQHISEQTGGIFRKAYDYNSLRTVYAEIDQLERSPITQKKVEREASLAWMLAAVALLILLFALVLEATWLRVVP